MLEIMHRVSIKIENSLNSCMYYMYIIPIEILLKNKTKHIFTVTDQPVPNDCNNKFVISVRLRIFLLFYVLFFST